MSSRWAWHQGPASMLPPQGPAACRIGKQCSQTRIFVALVVGGAFFAFFYFKKRSRAMRELLDRMALTHRRRA